MMLRRLLLLAFLLGVWVQPAGACQDEPGLHGPGHASFAISGAMSTADVSDIGDGQRCECPTAMPNAEAAVTDASKLFLAARTSDRGSGLRRRDPELMLLTARVRTESFLARRATQPDSPPVSRLRQ